MGASIEASVSEGVPELSQGINYSCRIMPQSVRIWVTPRKDRNSWGMFFPHPKSPSTCLVYPQTGGIFRALSNVCATRIRKLS